MTRRHKSAHAIALFPFLAVLICTMGTLIVLLVVEMTQMRDDVTQFTLNISHEATAAEAEASAAKEKEEAETQAWRLKILQEQRDDMARKLAERRLELGHLDDHIGRLKQGLEGLKRQVQDLESAAQAQPGQGTAAADEEARVREKIVLAERDLKETEARVKRKPPSYAIVPYDGPNGTLRRPIYVECTADAVVIQPEGVRLTSDDFSGPLDAGNPLDASLRVVREYLAAHGGLQGNAGEPYPLLLVRPDGAWAYSYARGAMKSWDAEFGYELLDANMKLAYPPVDPGLKEVLERTVAEARRRQQLLAAAAPSRYRGAGGFARARPEGGFEVVDGPVGFPGTRAAAGGGAPGARDGFVPHSSVADSPDMVRTGSGGTASGTANGAGAAGAAAAGGTPSALAQAVAAAGGSGAAPGAPRSTSSSGAKSGGTAAGSGAAGRPRSEGFAGVAFSKNRGVNWGLPNASDKSIPITRPIRAQCTGGELVLVPERGDYTNSTTVRFEGDTRAAVDKYVNVVWKYMETWGIAGSGMYWKPVLRVEVSPDGETNFAALAALLQGSGIGVERVQP